MREGGQDCLGGGNLKKMGAAILCKKVFTVPLKEMCYYISKLILNLSEDKIMPQEACFTFFCDRSIILFRNVHLSGK